MNDIYNRRSREFINLRNKTKRILKLNCGKVPVENIDANAEIIPKNPCFDEATLSHKLSYLELIQDLAGLNIFIEKLPVYVQDRIILYKTDNELKNIIKAYIDNVRRGKSDNDNIHKKLDSIENKDELYRFCNSSGFTLCEFIDKHEFLKTQEMERGLSESFIQLKRDIKHIIRTINPIGDSFKLEDDKETQEILYTIDVIRDYDTLQWYLNLHRKGEHMFPGCFFDYVGNPGITTKLNQYDQEENGKKGGKRTRRITDMSVTMKKKRKERRSRRRKNGYHIR